MGAKLANWPRRTAATIIDLAVTIWLPDRIAPSFSLVLSAALILFNSVFMQTRTTQSFGKVILGVHLVWPVVDRHGDNIAAMPSPIRCLLRMPLHVLDLIFFVGFLRPIWNWKRQTYADSLTKTVVMVDTLAYRRAGSGSHSLL